MTDRDYYQVLGISRSASADEIQSAYKRLSLKFHPDKNPDDQRAADEFKLVQEALGALGDESTRADYDRFGPAYKQAQAARAGGGGFPGGAGAGGAGGAGGFDFSSLFGGGMDLEDLFGGGRRQGASGVPPRTRRGQDLRARIQIPFQVAALGGGHELPIQPEGPGGRTERLTIKIPPGLSSGEVLRLKGQGGSIAGGPSGDVLVTVDVAAHPWFRREGDNLMIELPVTPQEAVLGARIDVPTLDEGPVVVTIPPGTSSGTKLRLRGKGIINQKTGTSGDELVEVRIVVPEGLSESQRELYGQLAEAEATSGSNPRSRLWGES
jgi:DnaJ-class molecular chaperone